MRRPSWLRLLPLLTLAPVVFSLAGSAASRTEYASVVLVGTDEIFVGEPANQSRPGRVYVYRKTGRDWLEAAILESPTAAVNDGFGSALSIDGDRLAVRSGPATVHLFRKDGGGWKHAGSIAAAKIPGEPGGFGTSLVLVADWLFIGKQAPEPLVFGPPPDASAQPVGQVHVFKRGANGDYAHHSTLAAPGNSNPGDRFGVAIAADASTLLIGAPGHAKGTGIVYELGLEGDTWTHARSFASSALAGNDAFGMNVVLQGDQAVVASPNRPGRAYGSVYIFRRIREGDRPGATPAPAGSRGNVVWQELRRLSPPASSRSDGFAMAIAASDRDVLVGAWPADGLIGRVYVFPVGKEFSVDGVRVLSPLGGDAMRAGSSVSVRGNVAAVGAPFAMNGAGGLLIYERDEFGGWRPHQPMISPPIDELPALTGAERRCPSTRKIEMFDCGATDLLAFLPPSKLSHNGRYSQMSSIWGWTDSETNREWAIIGRSDGATFVDITKPTTPLTVADLPLTDGARPSMWREIKVYRNHAYIVSDGSGPHGVQVFDLTRLRSLKPAPGGAPQRVLADAVYRNVGSVHNIVINEDSGFAYAVGSGGGGQTCGGGLHMIDIRKPKNPTFAGCFSDTSTGMAKTGYSHDAQCVTYRGPDKRYAGREICIGSNETAISVADVTDKANPKAISRATYPTVAYIHQGWFDDAQRYFYVNDEGDEVTGTAKKTRTLIWDLVDLENPILAKEHLGVESSTDHNLYIKGQLMFQANYTSGLRVLSIADSVNPKEVAFFDTAPYHPNTPGFHGAWSVFPFFKSGTIIVSSIEQGLFVVRTADR
jgi:choice-of-anchor B domain-containing protein